MFIVFRYFAVFTVFRYLAFTGQTGGARCSSVVYLLMVQWDIQLIHPIELFLDPTSALLLYNTGCGTCYSVCGMVHIKEPLLLIKNPVPDRGTGEDQYLCP